MLENIHNCITYLPLAGEIDPCIIPDLRDHVFKDIYRLPSGSDTSPAEIAQEAINQFSKKSVCILIPGTRFDRSGTRHGRGKGWFDRFLSHVPPQWLRIGITENHRLSSTPLIRKLWDQPVDWIICKQKDSWETIETHARSV
ncbi:hypothetical protein HY621_01985 [Candidatus Uhrbacteria bacterium]|nr:hypothetical protein [Candidatus Uhrbacteria bacterium]